MFMLITAQRPRTARDRPLLWAAGGGRVLLTVRDDRWPPCGCRNLSLCLRRNAPALSAPHLITTPVMPAPAMARASGFHRGRREVLEQRGRLSENGARGDPPSSASSLRSDAVSCVPLPAISTAERTIALSASGEARSGRSPIVPAPSVMAALGAIRSAV
jgi:hypothetical protein